MDSQGSRIQIFSGQPLEDQNTMWELEKQKRSAEATTASKLNCLLIKTKKSLLYLKRLNMKFQNQDPPEDKLQPPQQQPQPQLQQPPQQQPQPQPQSQPLLPQQTQPSKIFSVPRVVSASACGKKAKAKPNPKPKLKPNPRVVSAGVGKTCPVCYANLSMWTDYFNTFCSPCTRRRWR